MTNEASLDQAINLNERFAALDTVERLRLLCREVGGRGVFTTSFGIEDQALTHLIFTADLPIEVITLDTGRLFPETYAVWSETEGHYSRRIRAVYPRHEGLEALIADQGIDGFYLSVPARHACCDVRKVEPLKRALAGASVWITGLRAGQSASRSAIDFVSFDAAHNCIKANPLLDWDRGDLVAFVEREHIPVNALHAKGYPSIGCAPCTRAIKPGEPERAGRWWWENEDQKECGLHVDESGRFVRSAPVAAEGPFR
ncbi:phosphoadenylyl-sulfate reductase [Roseiarcaceae bacterium H3SJ34-1]|uniref:phosphoadenylyl-sulfate reductase n=1 Tax=Terripilifer ovatus TaxID=3032367 RepID=UPI003AB9823B|nr:phosphoadenylyl-sulfate reductase [Roseiarcaceae bacterium H3SJ34-1]